MIRSPDFTSTVVWAPEGTSTGTSRPLSLPGAAVSLTLGEVAVLRRLWARLECRHDTPRLAGFQSGDLDVAAGPEQDHRHHGGEDERHQQARHHDAGPAGHHRVGVDHGRVHHRVPMTVAMAVAVSMAARELDP